MLLNHGALAATGIAACGAFAPLAAQAAPEGASAPAKIAAVESTILVTSTKQGNTSLADYNGAITIVDSEELEQRSVKTLSDLSYAVPNATLDPIGTFKGVANFSIRGLGINSSIPSIDPAVGLLIDGVYIGINAGTVFDMLDVEQVEVLRGPQGVSFGRNTTGGAVMVRTADPSERWMGYARAGFEGPVDSGRGGQAWSARAVVSGPLTQDLSFRLGALYADDQGYFRNAFDGENFGGGDTLTLRAGLAWRSDRASVIAKGELQTASGDGAPTHNNGLFGRDNFAISVNQRGFHESYGGFVSVRGEIGLGEGTLTNIFGWRKYDLSTRNDIDSTPQPIFESDTATAQEQFSNELTYALQRDRISIVSGLFLLSQDIGYDESRDLSFFGAPPQFGGGRQEHESVGLFGEVTLPLGPSFSLSAGLRLSHEEKSGAVTFVRPRDPCSAIDGTCPTTGERIADENNGFTDTRRWTALSPRLVLAYDASLATRLYASWSRGHRSGGFNLRITQPQQFEEIAAEMGSFAFDQERVDTFELGTNWQSADNSASVRAAAFWTSVDGIQRELNVPSESGPAQSIFNTGDVRIRGGEVEASLQAAPGLSLTGHLGYLDAEYRNVVLDLNDDGIVSAADAALELPRAPEWSLGAGAFWEQPVSAAAVLLANMQYQYRARAAFTDSNLGWNAAVDRLDAAIALACRRCGLSVRLFGRNLLDQVQFGGDTHLPFGGGPFSNGINQPFDDQPAAGTFSPLLKGRTLGVEVAADF